MRLATFEQCGEETAEVAVDGFKGGKKASPAFTVEAADRAAQAVNGFLKLVALGRTFQPALLKFRKLPFGDEVHGTKPLSLRGGSFEGGAFFGGWRQDRRVEAESGGQQGWWAFELLAADPPIFYPASDLSFGTGRSGGTAFAGACHRFVGAGERSSGLGEGSLGFALGGQSGAEESASAGGRLLDPDDLSAEALGLRFERGAFGRDAFGANRKVVNPSAGGCGALPPSRLLSHRGELTFAVRGGGAGGSGDIRPALGKKAALFRCGGAGLGDGAGGGCEHGSEFGDAVGERFSLLRLAFGGGGGGVLVPTSLTQAGLCGRESGTGSFYPASGCADAGSFGIMSGAGLVMCGGER
jgi:hypothetical protein